jgi:hypothetical protein
MGWFDLMEVVWLYIIATILLHKQLDKFFLIMMLFFTKSFYFSSDVENSVLLKDEVRFSWSFDFEFCSINFIYIFVLMGKNWFKYVTISERKNEGIDRMKNNSVRSTSCLP